MATFLGNKVMSSIQLGSAEVDQKKETNDFVPEEVKDCFPTYEKHCEFVVNQCRHDNAAVPIVNPRQLELALRRKN